MSEFTKGKWEAVGHRILVDGRTLAIVNWPNNTRLMAAAPEMYRILRYLQSYCMDYDIDSDVSEDIDNVLDCIDGKEEQE